MSRAATPRVPAFPSVRRRYPSARCVELTEAERMAYLSSIGRDPIRPEPRGLDPAEKRAFHDATDGRSERFPALFEIRSADFVSRRTGEVLAVDEDHPGRETVFGRGPTPREAWCEAADRLRDEERPLRVIRVEPGDWATIDRMSARTRAEMETLA